MRFETNTTEQSAENERPSWYGVPEPKQDKKTAAVIDWHQAKNRGDGCQNGRAEDLDLALEQLHTRLRHLYRFIALLWLIYVGVLLKLTL